MGNWITSEFQFTVLYGKKAQGKHCILVSSGTTFTEFIHAVREACKLCPTEALWVVNTESIESDDSGSDDSDDDIVNVGLGRITELKRDNRALTEDDWIDYQKKMKRSPSFFVKYPPTFRVFTARSKLLPRRIAAPAAAAVVPFLTLMDVPTAVAPAGE